jgi:Protein of unknown function (DUF669)
MPVIKVDFEGVNSDGFAPIPGGTYAATVAKVEYQAKSRSSGNPVVNFEFDLNDPKFPGRKMWRTYSLMPKALWGLKQTLERLGIDVPDGELEIDPDELQGKHCQLVVTLGDAWDGRQEPDPDNPGATRTAQQNDIVELLAASDDQQFAWS